MLKDDKDANETRKRKHEIMMPLFLLRSPVEKGFLSTLADLSSSASDKSFTTKPKDVVDAENINSQRILESMIELANIAPTNVVEVKQSIDENRTAL